MRRSGIPLSVLNTMQCAHVTEPEHLNSQKIESRYGSYHIEMLASDGLMRQSALSSDSPDGRVCRTFALTRFRDDVDGLNVSAQQRIHAGASIGATLKQDGWSILKATLHVGSIVISDSGHPVLKLMRLSVPQTLALHIYKLSIEKQGQAIEYATISEIHHPDYLQEDDVRALFPVDTSSRPTSPQIDELISIIQQAA